MMEFFQTTSCPDLIRASISKRRSQSTIVDGRIKSGHDNFDVMSKLP